MEFNYLINELLELLDKNKDIIKIKELQKSLLKDSNFLRDLENYRLNKNVNNKKKLYEYKDYQEYLESESNINLIILDIKSKFNIFRKNGCIK